MLDENCTMVGDAFVDLLGLCVGTNSSGAANSHLTGEWNNRPTAITYAFMEYSVECDFI
jgi:hypothetical protein